uniref:Uncharacterized protein n=1 Tax=Lepeophtheirus salmonis TaxID=72036 RepID=A0A0K2UH41_LEPSM
MKKGRIISIIEARRAGHSAKELISFFENPKSTVYGMIKAFDKGGKTERATHSTRSDKVRTKRFIAGLKRSIDTHPANC